MRYSRQSIIGSETANGPVNFVITEESDDRIAWTETSRRQVPSGLATISLYTLAPTRPQSACEVCAENLDR